MRHAVWCAVCSVLGCATTGPSPGESPLVGALQVSDGVDADGVVRELMMARPAVQDCHLREMAHGPVAGRVEVEWVIEKDGTPAMARVVSSTIQNPSVEGCLLVQLRRCRFPRTQDVPYADARARFEFLGKVPGPRTDGAAPLAGLLPEAAVVEVVSQHTAELERCYRIATGGPSVPAPTGKVTLEWEIRTDGAVRWARISATELNHANVERCLVGAVWTWRFPPPVGGPVAVSLPFVFH